MVGQTVRIVFFCVFASFAAHLGVVSVCLPNLYRIGSFFFSFVHCPNVWHVDVVMFSKILFRRWSENVGEESVCVICVAIYPTFDVDIREHWTRTAARCRRKSTSEFHFNNNEIIASKSTLATPENKRENCFFRLLNRRRRSISGAGTLTKKSYILSVSIHTVLPWQSELDFLSMVIGEMEK